MARKVRSSIDFDSVHRIINLLEPLGGSEPATKNYVDNAIASVVSGNIPDGSVTTAKIADGAVTLVKLASEVINYINSTSGGGLADGSVTTPKLADGAVTNVKIANNAVDFNKLADNAVSTNKIANSAVTTIKIADNAVTSAKLANQSVTMTKLGSDVINYIDSSGGGGGSTINRGVPLSFQEGGIIIPAYFSPTNPTTNENATSIISSAFYTHKPVIAVVNPSNGPGASVDTDYQTLIRRFVANNVYVAGYVDTDNGNRTQSAVQNDISQWNTLYSEARVLFLGRFPTTYSSSLLSYYSAICEHARNLGFFLIIASAGSDIDVSWFTVSNQVPDIFVVYESSSYPSASVKTTLINRLSNGQYIKHRIGALVYGVTYNNNEVQWLFKNFGWAFVTNLTGSNPYNGIGYIEKLTLLSSNYSITGTTRQERYKKWLSQILTKYRRVFYVSPGGLSTNLGTKDSPWSISHALSQISPYDAIIFLPGTYNFSSGTYLEASIDIFTSNIGLFSDSLHTAIINGVGATYPMFGFRIDASASNVRIAGFDVRGFPNVGIYCIGPNPHIAYNYIHDMRPVEGVDGGAGILLTDPGNAGTYTGGIIEGNHIHDIGDFDSNEWGTGTGGSTRVHGIYNNRRFVLIRNNLIYRIKAFGITHWRNPKNNTIVYNTIYLCRAGGISVGAGDAGGSESADNFTVVGNIVAHCNKGISEEANASASNIYNNNLVWANTTNISLLNGVQSGTITQDPQLIYPGFPGNYKLSKFSPAISAGESFYIPEIDFDLRERITNDLGCFAFYEDDNQDLPFIGGIVHHHYALPSLMPHGFPTSSVRALLSAANASSTSATGFTPSADTTYWIPFSIKRLLRIVTMDLDITTASTGSATIAIYSSDSLGRPLKRLTTTNSKYSLDTGSIAVRTVSANIPLTPGNYWIAIHFSSTPTVRGISIDGLVALAHLSGNASVITAFTTTGLPGSLAPTSGYIAISTSLPAIGINYII